MAVLSCWNIQIAGIAAAVPSQIVHNADYAWENEAEGARFMQTTGIEQRRIASEGQSASDLCREAASRLLTKLNWKPQTVELLVFVSQTPDYQTPATSAILQDQLQLPTSCLCLDINLGCSAYVYEISIAQQKKWFANLNPQVDFYFIIEWQNTPIGLIHTKEIDWEKKSGQAGIFIWEEKSIGTPIPVFAVLAMMDYNFETLQLAVIYAKILRNNQRVIFYNEMLGYEKMPEETTNDFQWYALRAERYWRCTERLRRIEERRFGSAGEWKCGRIIVFVFG